MGKGTLSTADRLARLIADSEAQAKIIDAGKTTTRVLCKKCKGSGQHLANRGVALRKCWTCAGSGTIEVTRADWSRIRRAVIKAESMPDPLAYLLSTLRPKHIISPEVRDYADELDAFADEALLVKEEMPEPDESGFYGTSIRDHLLATSEAKAVYAKARQMRSK